MVGRFPGPVGAHEGEHLALADDEVEAVDGPEVAEIPGQAGRLDHRKVRGALPFVYHPVTALRR